MLPRLRGDRCARLPKGATAALIVAIGSLAAVAAAGEAKQNPRDPSFVSIATGQDHTCGLTAEGEAYCWGSNDSGQLGSGAIDSSRHDVPMRVEGGMKFKSLTTGYRHTCALAVDGSAYCWGWNESGQLGNGNVPTATSKPALVGGALVFTSISAGATHTCGPTSSRDVYCWGGNWHGQTGDGTTDGDNATPCCHAKPVLVVGKVRFSQISIGGIHGCGITRDGEGYCWGNGRDGRLGLGLADSNDRPSPAPVTGQLHFASISARGWHSCALTSDGAAYCWGRGSEGQLGTSSLVERQDRPAPVSGRLKFSSLSVGSQHTCGLTEDGALYCWGGNKLNQVGGDPQTVATPARQFAGLRFRQVAAGGNEFSGHTCAITVENSVLCWGDNRKGQLGPFEASKAE